MTDEDLAVFMKGKHRNRRFAVVGGSLTILVGGSLFFIARDPDFSLATNLIFATLVGGSMIGFAIWWMKHELRDMSKDADITALRERAGDVVWIVPTRHGIVTSFEMRFVDKSTETLSVDTGSESEAVAAFLRLCPTARIGHNPGWWPAYAEDPESMRVAPGQGVAINQPAPTKSGVQNVAERGRVS